MLGEPLPLPAEASIQRVQAHPVGYGKLGHLVPNADRTPSVPHPQSEIEIRDELILHHRLPARIEVEP